MPPLVYIITLNWNRCADTLAFLESCSALHYPNRRLLVVDNASSDGSPAAIAARFPQVEQVINPGNLGFAAGMNAGLRHALAQGADYTLLANNDTTLAPDALDRLVRAADHYGADLVTPAIYYDGDRSRIWWLGGDLRPLLLEIRPYHAAPRGARSSANAADGAEPQPFLVDFITGCGMLISRRCLEAVGLFDERFFMYYEDSDYCLRAKRAGMRALVEPRALMYHKVATSSGGSDSPNERYQVARSSVQYFRKHARPWQWPLIGPYRAASALRTLVRLARRRRLDAARAYLRGLGDGILRH